LQILDVSFCQLGCKTVIINPKDPENANKMTVIEQYEKKMKKKFKLPMYSAAQKKEIREQIAMDKVDAAQEWEAYLKQPPHKRPALDFGSASTWSACFLNN